MSSDAALAGRLRAELDDLSGVVQRAVVLASKARERSDPDYLDGVALNLHGFYAGAERLFEEIAREIDGSVPEGREWHRDLLVQMSAALPGARPPVLSRESPKIHHHIFRGGSRGGVRAKESGGSTRSEPPPAREPPPASWPPPGSAYLANPHRFPERRAPSRPSCDGGFRSRSCLDEYRGFRHIVRNVYAFNLRPARLCQLVGGLESCHGSLRRDMEAFCTFLEGLD